MSVDDLKKRLAGDVPAEPTSPFRIHKVDGMLRVTIKELKEAIATNPKHPVAIAYQKTASQFPDGQEVVVESTDLKGLLENKEVIVEKSTEKIKGNIFATRTKKLGAKPPSEDPKPTPPTPAGGGKK